MTMSREYPPSIDDKGCVLQVKTAEQCVRSGRTVMALKAENGVVLLCELEDRCSLNKVMQVSGNIIAAGTGYAGDIIFLLNKCEILADTYRLKFQQDIPLDEFIQQLSDLISLNTILKSVRPYRASIIVAGWDASGYHVYVVNPDGQHSQWAAVAIGRNALTCNFEYEKDLAKIFSMSLKTARQSGVDIYRRTVSPDLTTLEMVWLKSVDKKIEVVRVPRDEIESIALGKE